MRYLISPQILIDNIIRSLVASTSNDYIKIFINKANYQNSYSTAYQVVNDTGRVGQSGSSVIHDHDSYKPHGFILNNYHILLILNNII